MDDHIERATDKVVETVKGAHEAIDKSSPAGDAVIEAIKESGPAMAAYATHHLTHSGHLAELASHAVEAAVHAAEAAPGYLAEQGALVLEDVATAAGYGARAVEVLVAPETIAVAAVAGVALIAAEDPPPPDPAVVIDPSLTSHEPLVLAPPDQHNYSVDPSTDPAANQSHADTPSHDQPTQHAEMSVDPHASGLDVSGSMDSHGGAQ